MQIDLEDTFEIDVRFDYTPLQEGTREQEYIKERVDIYEVYLNDYSLMQILSCAQLENLERQILENIKEEREERRLSKYSKYQAFIEDHDY